MQLDRSKHIGTIARICKTVLNNTHFTDNLSGCVLTDCAGDLTDVFADLFNSSLNQAVVPTCFKATAIIPVLKKPSPSSFNDYSPVALTPILKKQYVIPTTLEPLQFAYPSAHPMTPSPLPFTQPLYIWTIKTHNTVYRLQFNIQHSWLHTILTFFNKFVDDTTVVLISHRVRQTAEARWAT